MKRKILPWALVILWMALIFLFSHQPATESAEMSSGITRIISNIIKAIASNIDLNQESLHHIIRKCAHFTIYLILGLLVHNALIGNNISTLKRILLAFLICVLYAVSDEIHQIFIPGRSGQISDVLLDSSGGLLGILILHIFRRRGA